jgi:hypothetical protein
MTLEKYLNRLKKKNRSGIFLAAIIFGCFLFLCGCDSENEEHPNVVFVFADQRRAQDVGYNGNDIVQTIAIDRLVVENVVFANAISGYPVYCPYRASLLTGQYPITNVMGMILKNPQNLSFSFHS